MVAAKQQSWKIRINARAHRFHFKFKATSTLTTFNFLKFSLFLKFYQFLLQLKTESRSSIPRKQTPTLKCKLLKIIQKFKISRTIPAEKAPVLQNPERKVPADPLIKSKNEEPICIGSLFVANIALLSKSIVEKDQKGIITHGLTILFFLVLFFKKYVYMNARRTSLIMIMFVTVFIVIMPLDKFIYYGNKNYYVFQLVRKGWNYAASSGFLYVISQVIRKP